MVAHVSCNQLKPFNDNDTDVIRGQGKCKGKLYSDDFLISYSKQPPKHTILLISTAELPELFILTNSGIKAVYQENTPI